jgi:hypothetical protein
MNSMTRYQYVNWKTGLQDMALDIVVPCATAAMLGSLLGTAIAGWVKLIQLAF